MEDASPPSSSSSSSSSSLVSKARTAFHSAAAKAERVLTDFKSDFTDRENLEKPSPRDSKKESEPELPKNVPESQGCPELKSSKWRPSKLVTKQDWQVKLKNFGRGRKGVEDVEKPENPSMAIPFFDENVYQLSMRSVSEPKGSETVSSVESSNASREIIPTASIMRQLAIAVEAGKKLRSVKDLLASSGDSSPLRERAGLSLSAMKSLVLRDKEDHCAPEFNNDEKIQSLIISLFARENQFSGKKVCSDSEKDTSGTCLPKDIHGAPPESFVIKLAEAIGSFKTLRKMALFWCGVVAELRRIWSEGQHVRGIPLDEIPDLNSCLLHQQLQVINCCVSRKKRRTIAAESLDSVITETSSNVEVLADFEGSMPASHILYARVSSGDLVLRLGAHQPSENLKMLETGEPIYSPITQEVPLLTEDIIKETEEFILRTGSVGAGCSQLLSDMQAFKAANPGCILEDFVRWHSPPDWTDTELSAEAIDTLDGGDLLSTRGQLSRRMQKEGNLWRELWETAKPVPAAKQTPLYDEDLAVEGVLNELDNIQSSVLFEQLFLSLLGLGLLVAETMLSSDDSLSKLFYECKDYVVATCQGSSWTEKVDDLYQVYEMVEMMLVNPEKVLKMTKQSEESESGTGESKRRFMRFNLNFGGGKDRQLRNSASKDQKSLEESPVHQTFASFFDGKSSLFSKKPPKPESASPIEKALCPDGSEWMVV